MTVRKRVVEHVFFHYVDTTSFGLVCQSLTCDGTRSRQFEQCAFQCIVVLQHRDQK